MMLARMLRRVRPSGRSDPQRDRPGASGLRNDGIVLLNMTPAPARSGGATIIVVGVSRSGTSMVAASLRALGVFMGDEKRETAVHEDLEMAAAIEADDQVLLKELIGARDARHALWGFKRPMAFRLMARHLRLFRNPRFVVTFRDPVAIARRNEISMHIPFVQALRLARDQTGELVDFVETIGAPLMLVSYEKALLDPKLFVAELAAFCGLPADAELIAGAAARIENGPELYLSSARLTMEGHLDRVVNGYAHGWARRVDQKQPCTVVIKRGGRVIGRGKANLFRADLEKAGKEEGKCSFKIKLDDDTATREDVTAEIAGTSFSLHK